MVGSLSSRERMMAAIECRESDYVPLCFMIFAVLRGMCKDQYEFALKQLELSVDAVVDLGELPIRSHPSVKVKQWQENPNDAGTPLLVVEFRRLQWMLCRVGPMLATWHLYRETLEELVLRHPLISGLTHEDSK